MKVVTIELEVRLVLVVLGGGVEVDVSSSGRMVEVVKVVSGCVVGVGSGVGVGDGLLLGVMTEVLVGVVVVVSTGGTEVEDVEVVGSGSGTLVEVSIEVEFASRLASWTMDVAKAALAW